MRDWIEHAVWWHVYPLGFVGAERDAHACDGVVRRFGQLTAWLDYAVNLGVSGILLGPVFASSTHGYDTIDHFQIDPRLGDDGDFDAFINAAHRRGLRIVLDGVFNHVGRECPIFQRALAGGPACGEASWFHLRWPPEGSSAEEPDYATFEGHRQLVALNQREPAVAEYVADLLLEAFHEENQLLVALNVADAPVAHVISASVDRLAGNLTTWRKSVATEIALPPHGWGILASDAS
ncbi:hypothetical protein HZZ13_31920 [Bradyrhizobium sp. CNPSo 4010]|uniref:Glycosyl hydrolase family 13 catalytic domain-containing protein n=1 Tax=Bradyrhizobium agreste TaxID=2751811 RepID=A0ABS0PZ37_9BRAD|nr:alpha-amylase family glycosyl hydrolase [Bradyrhizobium agreste]MBH5402365.1 hypothetical protein [Bradyrhizobium agreste]